MLVVDNLQVYYGGVHALKGISFTVPQGKLVSILGANGAGKSTTLRSICGLVKAASGKITLDGKDLNSFKDFQRVKEGIAMVPEGRRVFSNLTVLENLMMGAFTRMDPKEIQQEIDRVFGLFPVLSERLKQRAGTLSGGEQQMLAVGRALMSHPRLLLMDEPSIGLSPLLVKNLYGVIREIHHLGMTILLVEQNAKIALKVADNGYVLETGRIVMEGSADELANKQDIRSAYLGV